MSHFSYNAVPAAIPARIPPSVELQQSLASRIADIPRYVDQLMRFIKPLVDYYDQAGGEFVEIALREALANAVVHGNEQNTSKRVSVTCRCSMDGQVTFTIQDEGRGFDPGALANPSDRDRFLLSQGRGLKLMRATMDEVTFLEHGTLVRMVKRLRQAQSLRRTA